MPPDPRVPKEPWDLSLPTVHPEQLSDPGIAISTGQINRILTEGKETFHQEQQSVLRVGLETATYIHTTDIREYVTRRKISGTTRSEAGRQAHDTLVGLKKTCRKLGLSF